MIGPHIIRPTPEALRWAGVAPVVKALDDPSPLTVARPDAIRVFRRFFPVQDLRADPAGIAQVILAALKGYRHPNLFVEVYNEIPRQLTASYADLLAQVVPLLHAAGVRVCGPSWATGDYDEEHWAHMRARGWCGLDAIAVHCYWADHGLTPWNALRYRQFWQPGDPPILITECGRDRVRDAPGGGWSGNGGWARDGIPADQYIAELAAYASQIDQDEMVLGATVFTAGPTPDWVAFDTDAITDLLLARLPVQPARSLPKKEDPMAQKKKEEPMAQEYVVGPGIAQKMREYGDRPVSPERYIGDWMSIAFGEKAIYVYNKDSNRTYVIPAR